VVATATAAAATWTSRSGLPAQAGVGAARVGSRTLEVRSPSVLAPPSPERASAIQLIALNESPGHRPGLFDFPWDFVARLLAGTGRTSHGHGCGAPYRRRAMTHESTPALRDRFNHVADQVTTALGSFAALAGSVLLVVVWALTGPIFNFSDTWQLFINTVTTVITFWMVFVIQNSANRSAKATQLKLDEIIRALESARNDFLGLDKAPESTMAAREAEFDELARQTPGASSSGRDD
jgi:low affinity Fe/Cu permease